MKKKNKAEPLEAVHTHTHTHTHTCSLEVYLLWNKILNIKKKKHEIYMLI